LIYFDGRFFRDDAAAADFPVKIKGSTNDVIARCEAPWQSPGWVFPSVTLTFRILQHKTDLCICTGLLV
jgi:hypothetical protein